MNLSVFSSNGKICTLGPAIVFDALFFTLTDSNGNRPFRRLLLNSVIHLVLLYCVSRCTEVQVGNFGVCCIDMRVGCCRSGCMQIMIAMSSGLGFFNSDQSNDGGSSSLQRGDSSRIKTELLGIFSPISAMMRMLSFPSGMLYLLHISLLEYSSNSAFSFCLKSALN